MTFNDISELSAYFHRNQRTVKKWTSDGIVPGVKQKKNGKWIVSDLAMPPYTEKRIGRKDATSIRASILKAALKHKSTCAKLFGIAPGVFNRYVKQLKDAGLIEVLSDKRFPHQKFILTTPKTDQYFRDRGLLGTDGIFAHITSVVLEAAVEGYIKANLM